MVSCLVARGCEVRAAFTFFALRAPGNSVSGFIETMIVSCY